MKHYVLKLLASELAKYRLISFIKRVDDSTIKIEFDGCESYFFDLNRTKSCIYAMDDGLQTKSFSAPFDVSLQRYFAKSKITSINTLPNDRVLKIDVINAKSYKESKYSLWLEFTGKNTNAIITDDDGVVLEAMRHISDRVSTRSVKVGEKLRPIPPYAIREKVEEIGDIKSYLNGLHKLRSREFLESTKQKALGALEKKERKIKEILSNLEDEGELLGSQRKYKELADLILANVANIQINSKSSIELIGFDGSLSKIEVPENIKTAPKLADYYYELSKKMRQKAQNISIRRENLSEKLRFYALLKESLRACTTIEELKIYTRENKKKSTQQKDEEEFETFYMDECKIMIGRTQKQNAKLLHTAKGDDLWLHVKEMPSSHVIIRASKKGVPKDVIDFAAKMCVDFSGLGSGSYLVDVCKRKSVKIVRDADVLYTEYATVYVKK